jgi:hypothetical protein
MWPRVVEIMLGLWLLISPWIFGHYPEDRELWLNDLLCAGVVVIVACLSFWRPTRYAHLFLLIVGAWLAAFAWFGGGYPAAPGYQNEFFVGLTLLFFAFIPTRAAEPPEDWRRFLGRSAASRSGR